MSANFHQAVSLNTMYYVCMQTVVVILDHPCISLILIVYHFFGPKIRDKSVNLPFWTEPYHPLSNLNPQNHTSRFRILVRVKTESRFHVR